MTTQAMPPRNKRKPLKQIHVPVTEDQDTKLTEIAKQFGISKAQAMRAAVFGLHVEPQIDIELVKEFSSCIGLIGKQGGLFKMFLMINKGLEGTLYYHMIEEEAKKYAELRQKAIKVLQKMIRNKSPKGLKDPEV